MARITPEDPPEVLAEISYQQFYNIVDADIRRRLDSEISKNLRHPAVAIRWHQVLVQMRRTTEGAIAIRASEYRSLRLGAVQQLADAERALIALRDSPSTSPALLIKARDAVERGKGELRKLEVEFENWRIGTLRFKAGVEEKLTEAQWCRHMATRGLIDVASLEERTALHLELAQAVDTLDTLRTAIRRHRAEIDPRDASDVDEELWTALDTVDDTDDGAEPSIGDEVRRLLGGHRD
jgi:hypothetical protein